MRIVTIIGMLVLLSVSGHAQDLQAIETQTTNTDIAQEYADLILWDGTIYTADDTNPNVEAIAIKGTSFIHVGSRSHANTLIGPATKIISLQGGALYPGLKEAQAYLTDINTQQKTLALQSIQSLNDLKTAIALWRTNNPIEPILIGKGLQKTSWPEKRLPSRWDIDPIISDIPVIIIQADNQALVANSKALEQANITANEELKYNTEIAKNALHEKTGVLVGAAQILLSEMIPQHTQNNMMATGKQADITAFNIDLMKATEGALLSGKVIFTITAGEIQYNATGNAPTE